MKNITFYILAIFSIHITAAYSNSASKMYLESQFILFDSIPVLEEEVLYSKTNDSIEIKNRKRAENKNTVESKPQDTTKKAAINSISDVSIKIDNIEFFYNKDNIKYEDENYLFFTAKSFRPISEIRIYPKQEGLQINGLKLQQSADFDVLDSLIFIDNDHYRVRVRFHDLRETEYPALIFSFKKNNTNTNKEIKLFPYFVPEIIYDETPIELFKGEEKHIELSGENLFNVQLYPNWETENGINYRLVKSGSNLRLSVRASRTGGVTLPLKIKTKTPFVNKEGEVTKDLSILNISFSVKPSRLVFVNTDKDFVFYEQDRRRSEEIRIDYHSAFEIKRNYRIEDRQEAGGTLIAEIYVKNITSDNKVLADIRTYDLHRIKDGYLYIKDGSGTLFMTNFNIVNKPEINSIEILREGKDWTSSANVYPGERIEVKIEGTGLLDAEIKFEGCEQTTDSLRQSDQAKFIDVTIPVDIPRKKIIIFLNNNITRHELLVREYQRPAEMDFVMINYGTRNYEITNKHFNQPLFYNNTIRDINIIFDPEKIDSPDKLNGKQYLNIEIRILDVNNKLLDLQAISNIVVCPGERSPRHAFYSDTDCDRQSISINDHLLRKTYNLDAFSQIIITVKHNENQHGSAGKTQKATIFVERKIAFDIMVSFPAGLLVKEFSESGIGNLSGISTSVLAEISFYDPNRIGSKRPYKIGAGFIALNAFNFADSENIKRDIGLVTIGVIEPIRSTSKFSVPIYFGLGYLLIENDFFAIFGPGIRLNF